MLYNQLKFKFWGIEYGAGLCVCNKIFLTLGRDVQVIFGKNFMFTSGDEINPLCRGLKGHIFVADEAKLNVGDNVGISSACLWANESITIGNNVKIGGNCIIMDTDAHNLDYRIRNSMRKDDRGRSLDIVSAKASPIIIEDDVLIGTSCIILKGVTIGARSIIAAGSVVTKSIPADCIAGGNPCRVIRTIN